MTKKFYIHKGWKFRSSGKNINAIQLPSGNRWLNAEVPGTVHTDLLKNKLIPDPFYSDNEKQLVWINDFNWTYKTKFDVPASFNNFLPVKLVFEGVDTVSRIYLNGKEIGRTENMFIKYEFDITENLRPKANELVVEFESPVKYSQAEENKYGKLKVALNSYRVYLRKAQYSFGWDWGPSFPTVGMWKEVYLTQSGFAKIENVIFNTVDIRKNSALVELAFDSTNMFDGKINAVVSLAGSKSGIESRISNVKSKNRLRLEIDRPELWMPNGYGSPNLYDLEISLFDSNGKLVDSVKKKVGIRKIELQLNDKGKNTFRFVVNGKKIYAKGVNWIPGDAFLPRVQEAKYSKILESVHDANMNIVRVWGGGVYESEYFYSLCDSLGLLVWQDFMFACGEYPQHDEFVKNIRKEIVYNVQRLQYHPSIAIWCGNNENEWIWHQDQNKSYKLMSGYKIYSSVIPGILEKIDPARPYWESSPFGFYDDPNSQSSGNRHQWNIWSRWIDYNNVVEDKSLFVTEFGFQGPADKSTFEKYIPSGERKIHGEIFEFHNKQVEGPERVTRFLSAHLPLSTKWDDYIYLAQLNQGFALQTCLDHWRFNQPQTNGSIIWQINDTWPVTSWSLMDSELKHKIAYHFVKRAFAPVFVKISAVNSEIQMTILNQSQGKFKGRVELLVMKSDSGKILSKRIIPIIVKADSTLGIKPVKEKFCSNDILLVSVFDSNSALVSRAVKNFKEWKYLKLPKSVLNAKRVMNNDFINIILTTDKPAFFVDAVYGNLDFSDRGMIILPGEKYFLSVKAGNAKPGFEKEIEFYSLNKFLNGK